MYTCPLTFHLGAQKLKNVKIVEAKVFLYIFALKVEPAKPLDNAQIGRSFFNIIPNLLFAISPNNNFKDKLKRLIGKYPTIDITAIGFPTDWEDEPLWSLRSASEK